MASVLQHLRLRLCDYNNQRSLGSRFRLYRASILRSLIDKTHAENGKVDLLDVGGTQTYWGIFPRSYLEEKNVHITLLNMETPPVLDDPLFSSLTGDACDISAAGYDIAHSNSVIEHVGDWQRMKLFARQIRTARRYVVQTPSFWCPVEPHLMMPFIHWLPLPVRISVCMTLGLGDGEKARDVDEAVQRVEVAQLLDKKMMCALFPDGRCHTERFLLLTKSYLMVRE